LTFTAQPVIAGHATPEQIQSFHEVQADFRSQASEDALYLVIIGIGAFVSTYAFMLIVRSLPFVAHCLYELHRG
jgi:hypothetical protein